MSPLSIPLTISNNRMELSLALTSNIGIDIEIVLIMLTCEN